MNILGVVVAALGLFAVSTIAGNDILGTLDSDASCSDTKRFSVFDVDSNSSTFCFLFLFCHTPVSKDPSNAPSPVPVFNTPFPTSKGPSNAPSLFPTTSLAPTLVPTLPTNICQIGSDIDGEAAGDFFGSTVDMSTNGSRIAVGSPRNDGNGIASGSVRVFEWQDDAWVQVGSDIDGEAAFDYFGGWEGSIALSGDGNQIAVGAVQNNGGGIESGHVRVFELQDNEWVQLGSDIDGENADDQFGWSVAILSNGNRIAAGAPTLIGGNSCSVRVFQLQDDEWVQVGSNIDREGEPGCAERFGSSVSMSSDGNRIAVGAIQCALNPGAVRVFDWQDDDWVQVGSDINGEAEGDQFGWSVAMSGEGNRIASGAFVNDANGSNSGHVQVFEWQDNQWVQVGSDIDGEASGDNFGWSVAISSDGNRIVGGAPFHDGTGFRIGRARVFEWQNEEWIQVGSNIDGEGVNSELFGCSVAMSRDGSHIVVGGRWNDGNGVDSGHVRVFSLTGMC